MPKISVIVPVYNVEQYLAQCVESILAQTFTDIEVLLVNDASTDNSLEVAHQFKKDPRVRVLDKPHGGLGDTRNYGVEYATGKYLLFVDSDDWIDAGMLQNLYACSEGYACDMIVFNFVRENQVDGEQRICKLPVNFPEFDKDIQDTIIAELIGPDRGGTPWRQVEMLGCAWRRMYRRSWYLANHLAFYNEQEIMLEDLPVSIMAHCFAKRVLVVGGAYYHYRYNAQSLSTRYRPGKMEMLTGCFNVVRKFLQNQGLYEKYNERHMAWLLRSAAHSSLVNCFSPMNKAGLSARYKEVRGILHNPLLRQAAQSDYLANGTRADRLILRVIRTRSTPLVYLFYRFYSHILLKDVRKK